MAERGAILPRGRIIRATPVSATAFLYGKTSRKR